MNLSSFSTAYPLVMKRIVSRKRIFVALATTVITVALFGSQYNHIDLASYYTAKRLFIPGTMAVGGMYSFLYLYESGALASKDTVYRLAYWLLILVTLIVLAIGVVSIQMQLLNLEAKALT